MISVLTPSIRPEFLNITQECLEKQTFTDFEWLTEIGLRNRGFMLPSDLNKMLKRAKGDRIVMLQDCIKIGDNALELINQLPNEMYTFPVGQVMDFDEEPEWDWRKDYKEEFLPGAEYWEADFASAPLSVFFEVGGYDERFNGGWSWDNVEIAYRIEKTGRRFYSEQILGVALRHDRIRENPFREKLVSNSNKAMETKDRAGKGDFRLEYL